MAFNLDTLNDALGKVDAAIGTHTGETKTHLEHIATIGAKVAKAVAAGEMDLATAAGNFDDLTRAARGHLDAEARRIATAGSGINLLSIAMTALKVAVAL